MFILEKKYLMKYHRSQIWPYIFVYAIFSKYIADCIKVNTVTIVTAHI